MHKPKDVPRTTQQWASIICSISNLTPHWLYSSRFIASHRSLLSSHTQRITISIRNYMCDNPNRLPSIITKNGIPTACFSNPPQKKNFRPTRLRVQETWRNAERLPQRSLILQLVVGHRLLLYWLPRLYVQLGLSEFFFEDGLQQLLQNHWGLWGLFDPFFMGFHGHSIQKNTMKFNKTTITSSFLENRLNDPCHLKKMRLSFARCGFWDPRRHRGDKWTGNTNLVQLVGHQLMKLSCCK